VGPRAIRWRRRRSCHCGITPLSELLAGRYLGPTSAFCGGAHLPAHALQARRDSDGSGARALKTLQTRPRCAALVLASNRLTEAFARFGVWPCCRAPHWRAVPLLDLLPLPALGSVRGQDDMAGYEAGIGGLYTSYRQEIPCSNNLSE